MRASKYDLPFCVSLSVSELVVFQKCVCVCVGLCGCSDSLIPDLCAAHTHKHRERESPALALCFLISRPPTPASSLSDAEPSRINPDLFCFQAQSPVRITTVAAESVAASGGRCAIMHACSHRAAVRHTLAGRSETERREGRGGSDE